MSNEAVQPGDISVSSLTIQSSSSGSIDFTNSYVSLSIWQSIFTPGIMADIYVLDTNDVLSNLVLVGGETVNLSYSVPGGPTVNYIFALVKCKDIVPNASLNSKTYTLRCVSKEAIAAKTNMVQHAYNTQISAMVQDIHSNYLHSSKPLTVEQTKGQQKIIIPHKSPYEALSMLRKRAVSDQNKSSTFLYFETTDGTQQVFKFSTIEGLFVQAPTKTFNQHNSVGSDINSDITSNILAQEIPQQFSVMPRVSLGNKRRISQYNYRTHKYETRDVTVGDTSMTTGGSQSYNSAAFVSEFINSANIPPQSLIPNDTSQRPITNIADATPYQSTYISTLMQNSITIKVIGDPALKAGDVVYCNFPQKISTTGSRGNDPLLSGTFLISRIHHCVDDASVKPRYTCSIELLKGNMGNS